MRIVCEGCGAKYSVSDEKVRGRTVTIRCKKCGAAMSVSGPDAAPMESARADLFAASEASPFDGETSPPTPSTASGTGARHESSVLFSLASLASVAHASPEVTPPRAASSDGSGLLDIRALASATGMGAPPPSATPAKVDDLLGLGAPAMSLGSALAPAVVLPERAPASRSPRGLLAAAAIVGLGILGGAGVLAHAATSRAAPATASIPSTPITAPAPLTPPAPIATHEVAPAVEVTPTLVETPTLVATETPRAPRTPRAPSETRTPIVTREPTTTTSREPTTSETPSIEILIERATHPAPRTPVATTPTPAPTRPQTPARGDVMSAMTAVTPAVTACGGDTHGIATVQITLASDGHVSNAVVGGAFAGTPEGSCIARAVRGARVPAFQQPTFGFSYPFRM